MTNKRSELANILRRLADYIDRHPDEELATIFNHASLLMQTDHSKRSQGKLSEKFRFDVDVKGISEKLRKLPSREAGNQLLLQEATKRKALEALARFLQLPVQRDDSVERLRAKIVESTIGSRLRSEAIQG